MTNKTTSKRAADTQPESSEPKRHKLDKNEKRIYFTFIFFSKKKILLNFYPTVSARKTSTKGRWNNHWAGGNQGAFNESREGQW